VVELLTTLHGGMEETMVTQQQLIGILCTQEKFC
jgi:hypothetical protein